jgi:hypothetical protein
MRKLALIYFHKLAETNWGVIRDNGSGAKNEILAYWIHSGCFFAQRLKKD